LDGPDVHGSMDARQIGGKTQCCAADWPLIAAV
jgi:hypothetical protein